MAMTTTGSIAPTPKFNPKVQAKKPVDRSILNDPGPGPRGEVTVKSTKDLPSNKKGAVETRFKDKTKKVIQKKLSEPKEDKETKEPKEKAGGKFLEIAKKVKEAIEEKESSGPMVMGSPIMAKLEPLQSRPEHLGTQRLNAARSALKRG
jgi:hypothetical protein